MNYKIIVKPSFEREAKWLAKHYASFKKDYAALLDELERNPTAGTDLGGGLRKIRMRIASKGKGEERWGKGHHFHGGSGRRRNGNQLALYLRQGGTRISTGP